MNVRWWHGQAHEKYWLEATDRQDIGSDLRAPLSDSSGSDNWRYTLLREANPGDVVFHYDGRRNAIVGRSIVAGQPGSQPIRWAARGSYARARQAKPRTVPGYVIPLSDFSPFKKPVSLSEIRRLALGLRSAVATLHSLHGKLPLYFPFELSGRPVRPLQGYGFKLPTSVVQLLGLEERVDARLTISGNAKLVHALFERWRAAMLQGAERTGNLWKQPDGTFVFRNQLNPTSGKLGSRTALGTDPTGKSWAVQINEAEVPGDVNITSAIGLNNQGRPFLLRQGRLRPGAGGKPIHYAEFAERTGLGPAQVTNGNSKIRRDWYVVTPLDVPDKQMRELTARFVDLCALARLGGKDAGNIADLKVINELNAGDETGGTYTVAGRDATPPKVILKYQGEAWLLMAAFLRSKGISVEKPRHAAGYAVDAEIVSGKRKLLVEIKSAAMAADVYGGLGQLILYRKLIPRLAKHRPVLLLPSMPAKPLVEALANCGIDLCTYELAKRKGGFDLKLSPSFLGLCGL